MVSLSIPNPLSLMDNTIPFSRSSVVTVISGMPGEYLLALSSRLTMAVVSSNSSPSIMGEEQWSAVSRVPFREATCTLMLSVAF